MKLKCEGCGFETEAPTEDELVEAMMDHGRRTHSELWNGKSPADVEAMQERMDAHMRKLVKKQN